MKMMLSPQLPQYRVYATPVSFTYVLRPLSEGTKDLGEFARQGGSLSK